MTDKTPATPRPSATIVMVRDSDAGPEVLLVKRRAGYAFGNAYAFPGGVIDPDESAARPVCQGLSGDDANKVLGVDNGLDYYSAVIRELFEETGILLARDSDGNWPDDVSAFSEQRFAVDRYELAWPEFLRNEGLCMAADALHYFAWWITPIVSPTRWTTRFFVAALPPGQVAEPDGKEVTDSRWLKPKAALELRLAGEIKLPQPTRRNLDLMADFESVDALLKWADSQQESGIESICPVQVFVDGNELYPIPGGEHYPAAESA
ncbi:MAG: NUDIX domain-containing protein [Gammaproteobacteria bacterium]|nr:NUDIX domain-containing protein [Gammaproteobacteria bacterium]